MEDSTSSRDDRRPLMALARLSQALVPYLTMSSLQRFFLTEQPILIGQSINLAEIHHQLQTVLRLQAGDSLVLLDGQCHAFQAELSLLTRKEAIGRVLAEVSCPPEPTVQLTLYQATLKADKFEWVLQKGTELGVARFVPVISQRSIVRPAAAVLKKYERWQAIIREAAEQCGRGRLPELLPPLDWSAALADAQGIRLLPWEEQHTTTYTIKTALTLPAHHDKPKSLSLLVGPEGGIAQEEAAAAQSQGWQLVSLGPRILRAETAALTSIVLAMAYLTE